MRLHRRQFVLGPTSFRAHEDWHSRQIDAPTWLSYCPALRALWSTDADGRDWVILGLAIETLEAEPEPRQQISRTPTADVPALYASWAGRWALVGRGQIYLDASGLLGCFYGSDADTRFWASSSPALLAEVLSPVDISGADDRRLQYEVGISWYVPPRSRLAGIYRLLPSQVLEIEQRSVRPRALMPEIAPDRDPEAAVTKIVRSLRTTIARLAGVSDTLWLGLTAGYDSRLMLALSERAGVPIQPFTRISARTSVADRLLPPKLARACGYAHVVMRRRKYFPERQRFIREHSADRVSAGDAEPFIKGIRDGMAGIFFGGHGFARLRQLPSTFESAEAGARQLAQLFQEPTTSSAVAGLKEWLEWALKYPQAHLDWRDRFFIEQRQASWLSAKEQLYDLMPLERFPILNSAKNYATLLGIPESKRLSSIIQTKIIHQVAPSLLQYPFNPKDSELGLWQVIKGTSIDAPRYLFGKVMQRLRGCV